MPTISGKVEGRGNGIKTVIVNVSEVSLSLHRDAGELNKFFGCELGAQTSVNDDRYIVNGSHTDHVLQDLVHRYVEKFVLCPNCGLPETNFKISLKKETIHHVCAACGAKEMVDMSHKLCTYILSQEKKKKAEEKKTSKGDKKGKGKTKDKDKGLNKPNGSMSSDGEEKEGSTVQKKDKKKEKKNKKKEKKEKKKEKKQKKGSDPDPVDDVTTDIDNVSVDDITLMSEAVENIKKYLVENPSFDIAALTELVVNEQMASGLKTFDKVHIMMNAAFNLSAVGEKQVAKFAPVLDKLVNRNITMERHVIAGCEGIFGKKPKVFPIILKQLYDEDVLQEDTILEWSSEGRTEFTLDTIDEDTRSLLRGEAETFVNWLESADSEDESDNE
eukprot:CAMPEP_0113310634 /NCGR_PEP_ID=MMETSP0010_2-20120614/8201_1 /TAXON_ID=216773 ORGANISM="Corethron hystrix, Strain 308" /NCGR_SAMPLE_ID=MMETSP0010_2 /ASSEMBLY_ACC=CAM_ASM_000155 /LENGTH=385 /DNA_ID=CAMNT_0000166129 /DNA_START=640 /DNA_END=1797 /DNA_ORIENTATION=+ /assembly_acc=CAM_ASM_000155